MRTYSILAAALVVISGCASEPAQEEAPPAQPRSTVVVEDDAGQEVAVNLTNGTGAVVGYVLSDAGFGLPHARITILGADQGATTNATGWFEVTDVPPGKRLLHAERESYRAAETEVDVEAGKAQRVTITLVPAVDGDAGYRPHLHDYWAGRTEVQVMDRDWQFFRDAAGISGPVARALTIVAGSSPGKCVYGAKKESVAYASEFSFDDQAQLVWPGTMRIEVTITWTATDYPGGQVLGIAWHPANTSSYSHSPALKSGEKFTIPVEAPMWDYGHQSFSAWRFHACLMGNDEASTGGFYPGRVFPGKFHVRMTLFSGAPILADPPHPRFWQNGSTLRVLDQYRNVTCSGSSWCVAVVYAGRADQPQIFQFKPSGNSLVPPGTKRLTATLTWTTDAPGSSKPLSLTYSPANVAPYAKTDFPFYKKIEPTTKGAGLRTYEIPIAPTEADGFYASFSNWAFAWNHEGQEADQNFVTDCGCGIRLRILVQAHNT